MIKENKRCELCRRKKDEVILFIDEIGVKHWFCPYHIEEIGERVQIWRCSNAKCQAVVSDPVFLPLDTEISKQRSYCLYCALKKESKDALEAAKSKLKRKVKPTKKLPIPKRIIQEIVKRLDRGGWTKEETEKVIKKIERIDDK